MVVFFFSLFLGPFLEIGEERDHCLGREITSRPDLSLGLVGKIFLMTWAILRPCIHDVLKTRKWVLSLFYHESVLMFCPCHQVTGGTCFFFLFLADLGQTKGNRRPVFKRSGVQEITSFDRSMYRKFKFCLRLHKLGAFLRCFSCSPLSWNSDIKM